MERRMSNSTITRVEIAPRGQDIYDRELRSIVETEANIGKIIVIDVITGDYEIADEGLLAGNRLQQRHSDAAMFCLRIGYDAVYSLGGDLIKTLCEISLSLRVGPAQPVLERSGSRPD
jgi:hypothetical protein